MKKIFYVGLVLASLAANTWAKSNPEHVINHVEDDKIQLKIGDQAPQLKARWIKGNPVSHYQKGMVYVLEFWATWCGPCKKAMPHVTEMAKKYAGKATVIGVDVWERSKEGPELNTLVESFVKNAGETMGYSVCMDEGDAYMVKNYLEPTAQSGIPTTMIINQDGQLAWIGHPNSMEEPLQQIINKKYDIKAFGAKMAASQEKALQQRQFMMAQMEAIKPVNAALTAKDYKLAMVEYEKVIAKNPSYKSAMLSQYFNAQLKLDPGKAYSQAVMLKDSTTQAGTIAGVFAAQEGLEKKFYQYALDFYASQKDNMFNYSNIAAANFNAGNLVKAVEFQQKWIDVMKTFTAPAPAEYIAKEVKNLEKYKAAAQAAH